MKSSNHKISVTINTSAKEAWKIIGAVNGVDQWLAPITACRVEGDKRYCTTEQGEFSEDILKVDHENKTFKYAIPEQNMIPVANIIGQMTVLETADDKATIEWTWDYEVEEEKDEDAKSAFTMVGNMGIKGIEELILAKA